MFQKLTFDGQPIGGTMYPQIGTVGGFDMPYNADAATLQERLDAMVPSTHIVWTNSQGELLVQSPDAAEAPQILSTQPTGTPLIKRDELSRAVVEQAGIYEGENAREEIVLLEYLGKPVSGYLRLRRNGNLLQARLTPHDVASAIQSALSSEGWPCNVIAADNPGGEPDGVTRFRLNTNVSVEPSEWVLEPDDIEPLASLCNVSLVEI